MRQLNNPHNPPNQRVFIIKRKGGQMSFVNTLYYGDNLPILRDHIQDASVDLIYL